MSVFCQLEEMYDASEAEVIDKDLVVQGNCAELVRKENIRI